MRRQAKSERCPNCLGKGTEADYVGLDMRSVEVECGTCRGTGKIPKTKLTTTSALPGEENIR